LKHGRYAVHLRRKLLEAGDREGEALYARIEARVAEAFCSSGRPGSGPADNERQVRRLTSLVWCFAARRHPQRLPYPKTNLECLLESIGCHARDLSQGPIQVQDGRRRIGLVFWFQRRRMHPQNSAELSFNEFWQRFGKGFRRLAAALDRTLFAGPKGTRMEPQGPEAAGREQTGGREETGLRGTVFERLAALAGLGEWETGLRSRIFRLRRPNIWARLHYGLDRDGTYSPTLEARGRRELKKLCLAGIPVSSPPPLLGETLGGSPGNGQSESPGIDWTLIPFGFEKMP
jgi:hypothetical protein